jgi:hypothetical protein
MTNLPCRKDNVQGIVARQGLAMCAQAWGSGMRRAGKQALSWRPASQRRGASTTLHP